MSYSISFVRLNWITLVFIYLVVVAGSFVRITGSGMGCPDWPKCFGQWVPPTSEKALPQGYKDIYIIKRTEKVNKFTRLLNTIGFGEIAKKIRSDRSLLVEQDFNVRKTWTEYINRVFGVFAGFGVLFVFIQVLRKFRNKKLVILASFNLVFLIIQAWFGSIVVATNLLPWTITLHMFLALLIIVLQLSILLEVSPRLKSRVQISGLMIWIVWIVFGITFLQMFLGTQVREAIDVLTKQGFTRMYWVDHLGIIYLIHRSFSWIVLGLMVFLFWKNQISVKRSIIRNAFLVLVIELCSGVLLAYADMPGLVQTSHLVFACILFGMLYVVGMRSTLSS